MSLVVISLEQKAIAVFLRTEILPQGIQKYIGSCQVVTRLWFRLRILGSVVLVGKLCGLQFEISKKVSLPKFHRHKRSVESILEGLATRWEWGDKERKHTSWDPNPPF